FDVRGTEPRNESAGIFSPKASVVVGGGNVEAFANWGRGFHSNDARGDTTPLVRSDGSEVGLRAWPVAGLQSAISLWQLRLASELVFVGDAGTTEAGRPSRRSGIEWTNHYVVNPNLLLDLDLAASRARFTDDDPAGNYIPGALDRVVS